MIRKYIILAATLPVLLIGCTTLQPEVVTQNTCAAITNALVALSAYRNTGRLSQDQIDFVDDAVVSITPVCNNEILAEANDNVLRGYLDYFELLLLDMQGMNT